MSAMGYSTYSGRINEVKGEILAHAIPVEVLAMGCTMKQMPRKQGDNITYRRWLPYGATATNVNTMNRPSVSVAAHLIQEGVNPAPESLVPMDVNVKQNQYGCLYSYTDKAAELYEDDIPQEMITQTGERMGLLREMIRYGVMKACTNVTYAGGSDRASVDEPISLNILRRVSRNLKANHASKKRKILAPSANYDTYAIEASFIVYSHTDAESDVRDLPGFVPVAKYGQRQPISEHEIGSCEEFRFVMSPELGSYQNSGAAVGTTGLFSTGGSNIDVYPFIVMGEEAVFDVALRGLNSFSPYHIPHTQRDKSDPGGRRGYVGADFWAAVVIVNGGWMHVVEAGISALT
jgi:N4-gp56 family major capsid protein